MPLARLSAIALLGVAGFALGTWLLGRVVERVRSTGSMAYR